MRKNKPVIDLIGFVFWDLTVIEQLGLNNKNKRLWLCRCKCGNTVIHDSNRITSKYVKTCGCGQFKNRHFKHGLSKTAEYKIWLGMKGRCNDPMCEFYYLYGGRNIRVCDRWMDKESGFLNFLSDMGNKPSTNHSIDRIDNDKDYEPTNCRWATTYIQTRNKRNNVWIEYMGAMKIKNDWASFFGVAKDTLSYRLSKGSISDAIDFYSKKKNIDYRALLKVE